MPKAKKIEAIYAIKEEMIIIWIPFNEQLRHILRSLNAKFDSDTCYYNLPLSKHEKLLEEVQIINYPLVEGELPPPKQRKIEVIYS